MARGIHEAFVYQPINVARDLGAKFLGRLVDIQSDPDVPLPLDEAGVIPHSFAEPHTRRLRRRPARRPQVANERPHLELAVLELLLNFVEPLLTGGRVALEQPTRRQQVQRCAGLRLQEAVVKVARHAHAFLERPGILKATNK